MAKSRRRTGKPRRAVGTVLLAWELWRRIPSWQRRRLLKVARKHGPRLAKTALRARRAKRRLGA